LLSIIRWAILIEVFRGFPKSLIIPDKFLKIGYNRLFPNPNKLTPVNERDS